MRQSCSYILLFVMSFSTRFLRTFFYGYSQNERGKHTSHQPLLTRRNLFKLENEPTTPDSLHLTRRHPDVIWSKPPPERKLYVDAINPKRIVASITVGRMGTYTGNTAHVDTDHWKGATGPNSVSESLVERSLVRFRPWTNDDCHAVWFNLLRNGV